MEDPWRTRLDEFELEYHNAFFDWLDAWMAADSEDELSAASSNIDPDSAVAKARSVLEDIEAWLIEETTEMGDTLGIDLSESAAHHLLPRGWLLKKMIPFLNKAKKAMEAVKNATEELVEFSTQYSGLSGIVLGAIRGATNPLDGLLHLIGEGSIQQEATLIQRRLQEVGKLLDNAVEFCDAALDAAVIEKWNNDIAVLADETG